MSVGAPVPGRLSNWGRQMDCGILAPYGFLVRLLLPLRARRAFCRARQARRIAGRFEQLFDAARLLEKFEIPAHEMFSCLDFGYRNSYPLRVDFHSIRE